MATLDDIIEVEIRHCLRRARALCKIYAGEMYGETAKAREAYERLKRDKQTNLVGYELTFPDTGNGFIQKQ